MFGNLGPLGALGTKLGRRRTVTATEIIGSPVYVPEYNQDGIEFVQSFRDLHFQSSLKARVIWSTTQTSAGAATFRLQYAVADPNSEEFPSFSNLDTAIAKDTIIGTSANDIQKTEYGSINPKTVSSADVVKFRLEFLSASTLTVGAGSDNIKIYGVEFEYKPSTIL